MSETIKDAEKNHWVYRMPKAWIPYLQLSRLDRPIGYWLLTLPGWIALSFASLSHGLDWTDLKWALLILIGAIAMRGAGCTYNDIVDRDLDAKVDRTALRPIPAATISVKQAWIWLLAQCFVGLIVLLFFPRLAQIVAICSIPLVAAYPFMKRITWWPQVWLGMTFNWAALVAYAAKTGQISDSIIMLYVGLIFWTVGYDTIYACQDIEDDAFVGIKSTARRFGRHIKLGISICFTAFLLLTLLASYLEPFGAIEWIKFVTFYREGMLFVYPVMLILTLLPTGFFIGKIIRSFDPNDGKQCLKLFKDNRYVAFALIITFALWMPVFELAFAQLAINLTP